MIARRAARRKEGLDSLGFRSLLHWLGPDEPRAAEGYELLRRKLIVFFMARRSPIPEELADEVLDRLGRKLASGEAVKDLSRYSYGIARLVLTQATRDQRRRLWLLERNRMALTPCITETPEPGADRLRACTARLSPGDRHLITQYYEGAGRDRQEARRALAEHLGIPPAALRLRVFRLKRALEHDIRACLGGGCTWPVARPRSTPQVGATPGEPSEATKVLRT